MFSLGGRLRGVCIFIQSENPLISGEIRQWPNLSHGNLITFQLSPIHQAPIHLVYCCYRLGCILMWRAIIFEATDLQQLQKQKSYQSIGLTCTWHLLQIMRIPLEEPMAFKLAHPNQLLPCMLCPLRHTTNLGFLKKSNLSFGLRDGLLDQRPTDNDA